MQLSTLVTGNTYRNPTLLGKAVTTLDVVSAGRAILGIGELERRQLGFEFGTFTERFEKLEEALRDRGVVTGAALALALALLVLPPSARPRLVALQMVSPSQKFLGPLRDCAFPHGSGRVPRRQAQRMR